MKIAIAGAGAMGSRFGYMLSQSGQDVILIDQWKEHVEAVQENGLHINLDGEKRVAELPMYLPAELVDKNLEVDLIILFTKAMQLDSMLQAIQSVIHENTKVLCLLNGIGHEDIVEKYVAKENILLGNTMWTAGMEGPGRIKLFGQGSVDLQNIHPDGQKGAEEVVAVLNQAGLNAIYSENVLYSIYKKACVNGTLNGLCTLLDVNIAGFGSTAHADTIIRTIVDEFISIAAREGVTLDAEVVIAQIQATFDPDGIGLHYPSMYQDLMINNRLTEIDYINGAIVKKGQKYGIATPYCAFLTQLVHCKEEILNVK